VPRCHHRPCFSPSPSLSRFLSLSTHLPRVVTYYGPSRERTRHRIKRKWERILAGQDPGPDSEEDEAEPEIRIGADGYREDDEAADPTEEEEVDEDEDHGGGAPVIRQKGKVGAGEREEGERGRGRDRGMETETEAQSGRESGGKRDGRCGTREKRPLLPRACRSAFDCVALSVPCVSCSDFFSSSPRRPRLP
jgi:hypothetical protein